MAMNPRQRALTVASVVLYGASLFYPEAICISGDCSSWPGMGILAFGALAMFATPANMTWIANLILFVCWALQITSRWRTALIAGLIALGWAASFLLHDKILSSESGSLSTITGTAPGYWLWLAAMAMACVNAGLSLGKPKPTVP